VHKAKNFEGKAEVVGNEIFARISSFLGVKWPDEALAAVMK
jgi:hypothetical protein